MFLSVLEIYETSQPCRIIFHLCCIFVMTVFWVFYFFIFYSIERTWSLVWSNSSWKLTESETHSSFSHYQVPAPNRYLLWFKGSLQIVELDIFLKTCGLVVIHFPLCFHVLWLLIILRQNGTWLLKYKLLEGTAIFAVLGDLV